MTLHPWPSNDAANAHAPVLWKSGFACGLLTETPAVPLQFNVEWVADDASAPQADVALRAVDGRAEFDAALCRVSRLEGLLLPDVR